MTRPKASAMPYWKTGKKAPAAVLEDAANLVERFGGFVRGQGMGTEPGIGEAFLLAFELNGASFSMVWPVLWHDRDDKIAARRQAASSLFYDVKAKLLKAKIYGAQAAFFEHLLLKDGSTIANRALAGRPLLGSGKDTLPAGLLAIEAPR